ncbi:MAG: NADH-quinone oxidoreductase subunit L [Phycisphaerae bacterium]|nr:NADH-quinone oxidoreductase subunit L [Phycisphaerae bacterium]
MMVRGFQDFGMLKVAPLIPLAPLIASVLVGTTGHRFSRGASHWPVLIGVALALVGSVMVAGTVYFELPYEYADTYRLYEWIAPTLVTSFTVSFCIDPLTGVMLLTVCAISLLVVIYSRDSMRHHGHPERGYERFFAFLGLFVFAMCTLVLAGNFLLLFLGWEAVGLCSYLMIGFHYDRPAAASAARKAFLVNRVGDFGFGLGILCIYLWISPLTNAWDNPLDYAVVFARVGDLAPWQCTTIALLLFCGAIGKSAQLPLHVWLPEAVEGPAPVSALIHAATMVTAGVYMVARCGPIFAQSPVALGGVAVIGAVTAILAATIALAQYDMKRILAYSTISQLGFMFVGLGVGAADSAVFHLYTHAFFKALLFLGAGSVMHAMGGQMDVREFGGLRRVLPVTYATFLVGGMAMAGVPFLSGFFSENELIHAAFGFHAWLGPMLGGLALLTALLTAFYTFRMVFLAFHGPQRIPDGVDVREPGRWMRVPLLLLAVGAVVAGYAGVHPGLGGFAGVIAPNGSFHEYVRPVLSPNTTVGADASPAVGHGRYLLMYVSAVVALLGIAAAYVLYVRRRAWADAVPAAMPTAHQWVHDSCYVDEVNEAVVVRPLRRAGVLCYATDNFVIDGFLWLITVVPRIAAFFLRELQGGSLQGYGLTMTVGLLVILVVALLAN